MQPNLLAAMAKLCLAAVTVFASAMSHAAHDPVIMIPGMGGSTSNMEPMKSNLQSNGWPSSLLFIWTDSSQMKQDMAVAAQEIKTKVDQVLAQTGASKVVLVTWSASTIAGRYYIKNLGGAAKVSQYIAFAGPHHGISNYLLCQSTPSCAQWGPPNSSWLANLNSGTEVPGSPAVKYLTLRSTGDTNASPTDTAMLAGAENYLMSGTGAPTHFTIITDSTALAKMRSFIIGNEGSTTSTTTTTSTSGGSTSTSSTTTTTAGACYKSSNYAHVVAGRAYDKFGTAYAKGSSQNMGFDNLYVTSKLRSGGAGYYVIDNTCP